MALGIPLVRIANANPMKAPMAQFAGSTQQQVSLQQQGKPEIMKKALAGETASQSTDETIEAKVVDNTSTQTKDKTTIKMGPQMMTDVEAMTEMHKSMPQSMQDMVEIHESMMEPNSGMMGR